MNKYPFDPSARVTYPSKRQQTGARIQKLELNFSPIHLGGPMSPSGTNPWPLIPHTCECIPTTTPTRQRNPLRYPSARRRLIAGHCRGG